MDNNQENKDLYTRCPICNTAFKVSEKLLQMANGKVRCGACLAIFQATDFMLEPSVKKTEVSSSLKDSVNASSHAAAEISPLKQTEIVEQHALGEQPGLEEQAESIPKDQTNNFHKTEETEFENDLYFNPNSHEEVAQKDLQEKEFETAVLNESDIEAEDDGFNLNKDIVKTTKIENDSLVNDPLIGDIENEDSNFSFNEEMIEESHIDEELRTNSNEFAALKIEVPHLNEPDLDALDLEDPDYKNLNLEDFKDLNLEDETAKELTIEEAQSERQDLEVLDVEETEDDSFETFDSVSHEDGYEEIELEFNENENEIDFSALDDEESNHENDQLVSDQLVSDKLDYEVFDDELGLQLTEQMQQTDSDPDPLDEFDDVIKENKTGIKIKIGILVLLIILSILISKIWNDRQQLAWDNTWGNSIKLACQYLPCELKARRNVNKIKLLKRQLAPHDELENVLDIKILIMNEAEFVQPYPTIKIVFSNKGGDRVSVKSFSPEKYLEKDSLNNLMPVGTEVQIQLQTEVTHPDALGFEFIFE